MLILAAPARSLPVAHHPLLTKLKSPKRASNRVQAFFDFIFFSPVFDLEKNRAAPTSQSKALVEACQAGPKRPPTRLGWLLRRQIRSDRPDWDCSQSTSGC